MLMGKPTELLSVAVHYALEAETRPILADFNADGNLDVVVGSPGADGRGLSLRWSWQIANAPKHLSGWSPSNGNCLE
jgi:hypothetical protein